MCVCARVDVDVDVDVRVWQTPSSAVTAAGAPPSAGASSAAAPVWPPPDGFDIDGQQGVAPPVRTVSKGNSAPARAASASRLPTTAAKGAMHDDEADDANVNPFLSQ